MAKSERKPDYAKQIKDQARGRWAGILSSVSGLPAAILDGQHHPCPRCGGTDRFRFTDQDGDGSIICNQCARRQCGDGLATVQWATGWTFPEVVRRVADHLGISVGPAGPAGRAGPGGSPPAAANGKPPAGGSPVDPAKDLQAIPWSDSVAGLWCLEKPPIVPAAIQAVGGRLARYRGRFTVVDLPVWGEMGTAAAPVGHVLYNASGGTLPKFSKGADGALISSQVKIKLTHGSRPGLLGTLDRLPDVAAVWKVEGPSDLLALLSLPDLPPTVAIVTNANGAGEKPAPWMLQKLAGKTVYVIGDADKPGQQGAETWGAAAAFLAAEVRVVRLPYPVTDTHGRDVRDWLAEAPRTYADLLALAQQSPPLPKPANDPSAALGERIDDPHRLARLNLERYAMSTEGRTLRFWRSEWYVWKRNRYRKISEDDFRAKLAQSIKAEFDRAYLSGETDEVYRVTGAVVSNVIQATSGIVIQSPEIEFGTWIEDRSRRAYVSMDNGILDLDAVMAGKDEPECLLPHSPKWFSLVSVPYAFTASAGAAPPRWLAYLSRVLEDDQERIDLLQEWAGYLLLPDTGQQRFLVLEGDGANGKSVYGAAMTAMLGGENVSNIQLEVFGDRFSRTDTLGKLLNVCGDVGEIDKPSEGYVKSFTSGDRMYFDRKGVAGLNVVPTARLILACNTRPRFSDRSDGIWRRMLLVPFRVQIGEDERVIGMDKADWWEKSGELPAIFNWAVLGLARLRRQGRFTRAALVEKAREEYREEMNPALIFLREHVAFDDLSEGISCRFLYLCYSAWVKERGYKALSERHFGKEVHRFLKPKTGRAQEDGERFRIYKKIKFTVEEVCGTKIPEKQLQLGGFE